MKLRPNLLPNMIKTTPFLERVEQILNRRMLRRGQRQLIRLELLPLETVQVQIQR